LTNVHCGVCQRAALSAVHNTLQHLTHTALQHVISLSTDSVVSWCRHWSGTRQDK